jgi:hypothetical protein
VELNKIVDLPTNQLKSLTKLSKCSWQSWYTLPFYFYWETDYWFLIRLSEILDISGNKFSSVLLESLPSLRKYY